MPQRRKRIYLVADLTAGRAGQVLFESEGLSGYTAQGFRAWQSAAGRLAQGAGAASLCLNDMGGSMMDVSDDVTATLRAETHGHPPCVLQSAGFCTEHSAKAGNIGYEEETAPTLRAGTVPAAVYEAHAQDARYNGPLDVAPTVSRTYGSGGNNVPLTLSESVQKTTGALLASGYEKNGTQEAQNDMYVVQPYGIGAYNSEGMKSDNPDAGFYEADTARTLDTSNQSPDKNQGGIAVVAFTQNQRAEVRNLGEQTGALAACHGSQQQTFVAEPDTAVCIQGSMIGRQDCNGPQGSGVNEDVSFTLNTTDRHAVYAMTTGSYTQVEEDQSPTLMARDYKDPTCVTEPEYTVRRLTPTECARLQGFPDWWCADLGTENPSAEEIAFWRDVFLTHARIMGKAAKPKTDKQIIKWLRDPHTDSAEYRLWGNAASLNVVFFVLAGVAWADGLTE